MNLRWMWCLWVAAALGCSGAPQPEAEAGDLNAPNESLPPAEAAA